MWVLFLCLKTINGNQVNMCDILKIQTNCEELQPKKRSLFMSLTRKFLKDLGIEGDEVDKIINEHRSTVDSLRDDVDSLKAEVEKYKATEKEISDLKKSAEAAESYKAKYEEIEKNFNDYKTEVQNEKSTSQKMDAYKNLLKSAGIGDKRIDSVLKLAKVDGLIDKLEFDKDGAVKNSETISEEIKTAYSDYVEEIKEKGASTPNPPENKGGTFDSMTLAEKMAFANSNPDSAEVQKWMRGE